MGLPTIIQAPELPEQWPTWDMRGKQMYILREIVRRSGLPHSKFCAIIGCVSSHLSNALNGKRGFSYSLAQKIIAKLPLTDEMILLVRQVAGSR
jgi:hypothetical protein